jgi:hypothetical protein
MQKLDELIQATLQEREREQRGGPRGDGGRGKRSLVPYLAPGLMALCLLCVVVFWACSGAGT